MHGDVPVDHLATALYLGVTVTFASIATQRSILEARCGSELTSVCWSPLQGQSRRRVLPHFQECKGAIPDFRRIGPDVLPSSGEASARVEANPPNMV